MKEFTVTYRDNEGRRVSESFKAEDRAALFRMLQEKEINAMNIAEGVPRRQPSSRRPPSRTVTWMTRISVALAVIGSAVLLTVLLGKKPEQLPPQVKPPPAKKAVRAEKPAAAPVPKPAAALSPRQEPPEPPPQKVGETRNGYILLPSGRLHRVRGVVTNTASSVKSKYAIFKHPSENVLAGILMAKPGQAMVGTPRYNGRFTENFLKSLSEPILISDDDPADIRDLKNAMIEVKKELMAAHERGEDIEEIVLDARRECQEMAQYRHKLEVSIHEFAKKEEGLTSKDVDDYIAAANEMLAKKGIAPLNPSAIIRIKMKLKEPEN